MAVTLTPLALERVQRFLQAELGGGLLPVLGRSLAERRFG